MIFSHFSGKAVREIMQKAPAAGIIDLSSAHVEASPTPQVLEAMERALRSPETFGAPLAEMLSEKLGSDTIPVAGGKNALWLALQVWLNPGDEVLLFAPGPPHHAGLVNLLGAVPKIIKLDEEEAFFPDIDAVKAQISSRTRMLLITNPQQPTGALWDKESLSALARLAKERGLMLVSDEQAGAFIYEGVYTGLAECAPDKNHVVILKNLTPALPGWDTASLSACPEFLNRARALAALGGGGLNSTALFVLNEAWGHLTPEHTLEELRERRDILLKMLGGQHGFRIPIPRAGTSCFPTIRYYLGNEIGGEVPSSSSMFTEIVARKVKVALAPGSDYGMEGFIQCSFSRPSDIITEAVRRIASILEQGPAARL